MTEVEIISGCYGWKENGKRHVTPKTRGDIVQVSDAEAERLAALGVGRILDSIPKSPTEPAQDADTASAEAETESVSLDRERLMTMTKEQLLHLAADMGISTHAKMTKAEIADAICQEEVLPGDETPPTLGSAGPVL